MLQVTSGKCLNFSQSLRPWKVALVLLRPRDSPLTSTLGQGMHALSML